MLEDFIFPKVINVNFAINPNIKNNNMPIQSVVSTITKAKKFYDYAFIIIVVIAISLVIIQLINGNLKTNSVLKSKEAISFDCIQTLEGEEQTVDTSELKTLSEVSSIADKDEIFQTSFGKNDIPPITEPHFSDSKEIGDCLGENELVVVLKIGETVNIYPERILQHHLVVNDEINNKPILVSYCALCKTFQVYERTYQGEVLEFGTTGLLYKNNDLLFDTKTESLWSQYTGESLVGNYLGASLSPIPFNISTYSQAKKLYPQAKILNFKTGFIKDYRDTSYEDFALSPEIIAPQTNISNKFDSKDIIIGLIINDKPYAFPLKEVTEQLDFEIDSKIITIENSDSGLYVKSGNDNINFTYGFWYVWTDFFPNTKIIEPK